MSHLTAALLQGIAAGEIPEGLALQKVLYHLARACPECASAMDEAYGGQVVGFALDLETDESETLEQADYRPVFRSAVRALQNALRRFERDRQEATRAVELYAAARSHERVALLEDDRLFAGTFLARQLLDRARSACSASGPQEALSWVEAAEVAIGRIPDGERVENELAAYAAALRGNLARIEGDLQEAKAWMRRAEWAIEKSTGSAVTSAIVEQLKASVLRDAGDLQGASQALAEVQLLLEDLPSKEAERELAVAAIKRVSILDRLGDHWSAVEASRLALHAAVKISDRRLILIAQQNSLYSMIATGELESAERILATCRQQLVLPIDQHISDVLFFCEALLLRAAGSTAAARLALREAISIFGAAQRPYDAAIALLELIPLLQDAGDFEELEELSQTLIGYFGDQDLHREALTAVEHLRLSLRNRLASEACLAELRAFFLAAASFPSRPFRQAS